MTALPETTDEDGSLPLFDAMSLGLWSADDEAVMPLEKAMSEGLDDDSE